MIEKNHGTKGTALFLQRLWLHYQQREWRDQKNSPEHEFQKLCFHFSYSDFRLLSEYYSMTKPNKLKLATELARKNETLPRAERYGPRGTTSPLTMLQQIKRVLRDERRDEIAAFTPAQWKQARKIRDEHEQWMGEIERRAAEKPKRRRRTPEGHS